MLTLHGYTPVIPYRCNNKNIDILSNNYNKLKVIYKSRIKIENTFCIIKKNRRVDQLFEKTLESYNSFLFLAFIRLIFNKINI